jgi:HSP90 family molecular chaperone
LIGQFGVGFYSAFIVADRITVETRRAGLPSTDGVRWESDGSGEFTVESINRPQRGTSITMHLHEGEDDFLSTHKLKSIIRKYSDHISLPIQMNKEEWDADKKEQVIKDELESINQSSALWARSKSEITQEQYDEFYKHLSHDYENPLCHSLNRVEGRSEFTQLLYVPARAPFDLWDRNKRGGIKLYVKRVFIMDDAEQLMPMYLRFVTGVVDSTDLPLNVSREILQESRDVKIIRESSTKRVLSMLEDLANSDDEAKKEKYRTFWTQFGQVLKEGVGEDQPNQERILKLLRFASTHMDSADQTVSLAEYIARMKEGQDKIYYVTGDTFNAAKNSPHLEIFRKKTAPAFSVALKLGAVYAGQLEEVDEVLENYSEALGIAYQIRDDLSDLGEAGETNDIEGLRPSLLLAAAHERAEGADKERLRAHWERRAGSDPKAVEALYHGLGIIDRTNDLLERYKEQAIRSLQDVENPNLKGLLRRVIGKIFNDTEIKGWCKEFEQQNLPATRA